MQIANNKYRGKRERRRTRGRGEGGGDKAEEEMTDEKQNYAFRIADKFSKIELIKRYPLLKKVILFFLFILVGFFFYLFISLGIFNF